MNTENYTEKCLDLLKHLISINTVNPPGQELAAAEYLRLFLEPYGFKCHVQEVEEGRANLVAEYGEEGTELIFNGHLDVVPVTDNWATDPFTMVEKNEKIYARGSADMKGGVAAMCVAAITAAEQGLVRKGRLKLVFVADEECSNLGTHAYFSQYGRCKENTKVIIGEPTNLKVNVAHRGVSRDYITILGSSRHAGLPWRKDDPVSCAASAIQVLDGLNEYFQAVKHEILPVPSISVTMLEAYEKDNIAPGKVKMLTDCRILPGMTQQEIENLIRKTLEKTGIHFEIAPHFYMPGGALSIHNEMVHTCNKIIETVLQQEAEPVAFPASCEQCFWIENGADALILGPGDIKQAHTDNEYVEKQQLLQAVEIYRQIITSYLQ
ncbi:MAG: M20 family metallopeptidase [Lachnospiraceae bacterium]|nr:M20 family metallopeptidase [Lachnospiraceae bacterium]